MDIRQIYKKPILDYLNDPTNLTLYEAAHDFWIHNANSQAYRDPAHNSNGYQFTLSNEGEVCELIVDIHTHMHDAIGLSILLNSIVWT